jgi:hypothetical protein
VISRKYAYDKLLVLVDTTPHATALLQLAYGVSHKSGHVASQILVAQAADAIAAAHPADSPDPILLRDVLMSHFLD